MSIIYDALKKVESKPGLTEGKKSNAGHKPAVQKKSYSYLLVIVTGLALASIIYNLATKYPLAKTLKAATNVSAQAKLGHKLDLTGIFFSGDKNYALINNQILKEGDTIVGAKVRRITTEAVELDKDGIAVRLSYKK